MVRFQDFQAQTPARGRTGGAIRVANPRAKDWLARSYARAWVPWLAWSWNSAVGAWISLNYSFFSGKLDSGREFRASPSGRQAALLSPYPNRCARSRGAMRPCISSGGKPCRLPNGGIVLPSVFPPRLSRPFKSGKATRLKSMLPAPGSSASRARPGRDELLKRLRAFRGRLLADFKFDRDEANAR
jgi:hypothetical protein